jgi:hypothetical protein
VSDTPEYATPELIERAKERAYWYGEEDIEIDEGDDGNPPRISRAIGGTWVLAWIWVPEEDSSTDPTS